jgi:penicillin amidase
MNLFPELERYRLLLEQQLTPERIEQLWPPYPANAPTIVSSSSIHERNWNLDASTTTDQTQENERLKQLQRENKPTKNSNLLNWKDNLAFLRKLLPWMNFNPRASNNWVVSGKRTASGKPILANDPHLDLGAPSIWLLVHLEYPGSALIGATFAGSPGLYFFCSCRRPTHLKESFWEEMITSHGVQPMWVQMFKIFTLLKNKVMVTGLTGNGSNTLVELK